VHHVELGDGGGSRTAHSAAADVVMSSFAILCDEGRHRTVCLLQVGGDAKRAAVVDELIDKLGAGTIIVPRSEGKRATCSSILAVFNKCGLQSDDTGASSKGRPRQIQDFARRSRAVSEIVPAAAVDVLRRHDDVAMGFVPNGSTEPVIWFGRVQLIHNCPKNRTTNPPTATPIYGCSPTTHSQTGGQRGADLSTFPIFRTL